MSFTVRIFGYSGLTRITVVHDGGVGGQDSVYVLTQAYTWRQQLTADAVAVSSIAAAVPANRTLDPTTLLRIEIPDGQAIRYEVNHSGRNIAADANSPILSGNNQIQFGPGWLLSIRDAAGT